MKHILFYSILACLFASCEKKIDIDPSNGQHVVIIQAYLYNDSTAKVIIAKSTNFLSSTKPPRISNATVVLADNHGHTDTLMYNTVLQRYESPAIKGVVNDIYTLTVALEGQIYSSTSILPYLNAPDSIKVPYRQASGFNSEGYFMNLYANIPNNSNGNDLYFLFKGYANDSLLNAADQIVYADNSAITGQINGLDLGFEYQPGQLAKLYTYSLTKDAYKFYDAASIQLSNDGGFFSTPPANVPSMFSNGAVGLFQCSNLSELTTHVVAIPH
ncbi:MAG: DUF4249 domain-containing protein [Cytophagales bacterium]|nr:DUF4249 domain-containing protein [Cytophaga sp.]